MVLDLGASCAVEVRLTGAVAADFGSETDGYFAVYLDL